MICGIDPSLTNTAVVCGESITDYTVDRFGSKFVSDSVVDRCKRYEGLVHRVNACVAAAAPTAIFIEAYAFSRNDAKAKFVAEYGGLLRWHLADITPHIYEVSPMTLKKFVTGKGNVKKNVVMAHIQKRYGVLFENDDEADAFGLYQLGLVAIGITAGNSAQREAAEKILGKVRAAGQPAKV